MSWEDTNCPCGGIRKPREQAQAPKPKAKGEAYESQSDDVPF